MNLDFQVIIIFSLNENKVRSKKNSILIPQLSRQILGMHVCYSASKLGLILWKSLAHHTQCPSSTISFSGPTLGLFHEVVTVKIIPLKCIQIEKVSLSKFFLRDMTRCT